jgi:hypothetical protein
VLRLRRVGHDFGQRACPASDQHFAAYPHLVDCGTAAAKPYKGRGLMKKPITRTWLLEMASPRITGNRRITLNAFFCFAKERRFVEQKATHRSLFSMEAPVKRFLNLSFISLLIGGTSFAEDYLLRVEAVGFIDHDASQADPKDKVLHSIEAVVRPDVPCHAKIQRENETFLLDGHVESPDEKGVFTVAIRYRHRIDKGVKVPLLPHPVVLSFHETSVSTNIVLSLDEPAAAGEAMSSYKQEEGTDAKPLKSRIRHRVTLTKYEPRKN